MSSLAEPILSSETRDVPACCGVSSPPPLSDSYTEQKPPPYTEATGFGKPVTGYESFCDILPETQSDTSPLTASSEFDDMTVRRAFVRKVFGILTLQLLFTFSVVCVFTFSGAVKSAVQTNLPAYVSSFAVFAVVAIALSFCKTLRRRHPWNIVGLVVVTLSFSYMAGTVASFHNTSAVVVGMAATLVISLAIIVFSAQTKYDFTMCYGVLLILALDLIMFGFFCTFYSSYIAEVAYGCLGALLFSLFLMIDCQLMMGVMSFRLDPEEYISAALTMYLDIVLIFLYMLGWR